MLAFILVFTSAVPVQAAAEKLENNQMEQNKDAITSTGSAISTSTGTAVSPSESLDDITSGSTISPTIIPEEKKLQKTKASTGSVITIDKTKLYIGYQAEKDNFYSLYVRPADKNVKQDSQVVYCYNYMRSEPELWQGYDYENKHENYYPLYEKFEDYLQNDDPTMNEDDWLSGVNKMEIANVLYAGYPEDAYGLRSKYNLTET